MKDYAEINLSTGGKKIYETPYQCSIAAGAAAFNAETDKASKLKDTPAAAPDGYEYYLKTETPTTPTTPTVDQSLVDSLRATFAANGSLDIEAAPKNGQTLKLKIVRANGQPLTMQSKDGQVLSGNTFYYPGPLAGQGNFTQEWSFRSTGAAGSGIPQEQLTITLATENESITVPFSFTPAVATRQVLFTAPGANPTNPTNPTTPTLGSFSRGLIVGNSFTTHTASTALGWDKNNGMAASSLAQDYVHVMEAALKAVNGSFFMVPKGQGSSFEQIYNSSDPNAVANTLTNLNYELNQEYPGQQFDLVYISISENTAASGFNEAKFRSMLDQLIAGVPKTGNATIVLRNSFWSGNEPSNGVLQSYASQKGYKFVNLDSIRERADYKASQYPNAGVAHHPNDAGHAAIAQLSLEVLKTSTGGGTNPGSNTPTTVQGGYGEGTLANLFALCPFIPDSNQLGSWSDRTLQRLTNANIQAGIHKSICGSLTELIDLRNGNNMINTFTVGSSNPDQWDTGRSLDFSVYGHPHGSNIHPYYEGGQNTSQTGDDTGYNGVAGGSRYQDRSRIEFFQRKNVAGYGEVIYCATLMKQWSMQNIFTQYRRHVFYWLDGNALRFTYVIENFRTDGQRKFMERQQEGPFAYLRSDYFIYRMEKTAGNVEAFTAPETGGSTGTFVGAKNYIGGYHQNGYGMTMFTPYNSRFEGKQFMSRVSDNVGSFDSAYISAAPMCDMDNQACTLYSGYYHVGTHDEFRSWLSATNPALRAFNFDFSGGRLQGWATSDGRLFRENGETVFGYGDEHPYEPGSQGGAVLNSPYGNWSSASLNNLKMTIAVVGASQIEIRWRKPSQGDADAVMQRKTFNVTGDGNFRDYEFSMTGASGWDGIISRISIGRPLNGSVPAGAKIRLGKIYA